MTEPFDMTDPEQSKRELLPGEVMDLVIVEEDGSETIEPPDTDLEGNL